MRFGDKNTSYFYRQVLSQRKMNFIHRLKREDGVEANNIEEIEDIIVNFFQKLISLNGIGDLQHILSGIDKVIILTMNDSLLSWFTEEKVFIALKGMRPTKAPGFD